MPRRAAPRDLTRGLGRPAALDRLDRPLRSVSRGVVPTKGKGWGQQGEAVFPDLLSAADRNSAWARWRKGMALARDGLIGAAERFTAVVATHSRPGRAGGMVETPLLLAGFTSRQSPEGRWTVAIAERGSTILSSPVSQAGQQELWLPDPDDPGAPPRRLLGVTLAPGELGPHHRLIGELLEDSALSAGSMSTEPTDGVALLCVGVDEAAGLLVFDAERCWRRVRTDDGRLELQEQLLNKISPLIQFRVGRHLAQGLTMACNCPAYQGVVFANLRRTGGIGTQDLFEQDAPGALDRHGADAQMHMAEGVSRQFSRLHWARVPAGDCKHVHAVRWALGCPLAEPGDVPTLESAYWRDPRVMARDEDMEAPLASPRFLEQLRESLLTERAFAGLDVGLLAAAAGECTGVMTQRVELQQVQLIDGQGRAGPRVWMAAEAAPGETWARIRPQRLEEQHYVERPDLDDEAMTGDWFVGRGTQQSAWVYEGPGQIGRVRALRPLQLTEPLPEVIP